MGYCYIGISVGIGVLRSIEIQSYLSSLPILAVVYRLFYLPTANLPIYHNLPISTDFFADLPNFNFYSTDTMLIDRTEQELSFLGELFLNKGTKIVPQCIVGS